MPALTLANMFAWSFQVAVILLVGGGAMRAARLPSPRVRLACLRALLIACLVVPLLAVSPGHAVSTTRTTGPAGRTAALHPASPDAALSLQVTPATASRQPSMPAAARWSEQLRAWAPPAIVAILLVGTFARFVWLSLGLLALRRLRKRAGGRCDTIGERGTYSPIDRAVDLAGATADIRISSSVTHPVTFGLRHPIVMLPESIASLDESEQVAVLCHELIHVRRRDWLQTVSEEVVRALLWFHPAVWWLLAQMDLSREQVVDQEVVEVTERRQLYVNALVTLATTPGGPVLRPASLFLGRAHLVERVALLSREVRMSRPRVVLSLVLIAAALLFGAQLVVHAFPLTGLAIETAVPAPPTVSNGPGVNMVERATVSSAQPEPVPPSRTPAAVLQAAPQKASRVSPPAIAFRTEPVVPLASGDPAGDAPVILQVTIDTTGELVGPIDVTGGPPNRSFGMHANDVSTFQQMLSGGMLIDRSTDTADRVRAAYDALRQWRFEAPAAPVSTVVGFNFARTTQSGLESVPVRIGGAIKQPMKVKDVKPIYPADAQANRTQGVVILELTIDGAGIPIVAYAVRPIEGLTVAAIQAALQWRFEPDPVYTRRLMTVTVNFTLSAPPPPPPPPPPPAGGVAGGVEGGVVGGTVGGVRGSVVGGVVGGVLGAGAFGPPRSEWPANAVRVGGNIKQPTRIRDAKPVYPPDALAARVQGVVIAEVLVGTDGTVQAAQVLRSIPMLDQNALDAVRQWQFTPTLLNGNPVPVIMTVTVNFTFEQ